MLGHSETTQSAAAFAGPRDIIGYTRPDRFGPMSNDRL
jgi:hypothetical protein